jgi:hypothetical protein
VPSKDSYRIGVCGNCGKRKKLVTFYDECALCEFDRKQRITLIRERAKKEKK